MRNLLTLLMLLAAPQLFAQTSSQQLTITKAGYFLTVVDVSGMPQYVKIVNVVDLTGDAPIPDPTPNPGPDPNPPQLDMELVRNVQSWATEAKDPQASQALAAVYSIVRDANLDAPWPVLKLATDEAISILESKGNWEPFRKNLSAVLSERSQRGTLDSPVVLNSVRQGLEMSADGSIALPEETLNKIKDTTKGLIKGVNNATE